MKVYLGFAKRDLSEWKEGDLFTVQAALAKLTTKEREALGV